MRIERIELYNFGSYEGLNAFELLSDDPAKRIIIVGGKNGAGKTTLFTAMQICLYGHASFGFKNSGKRYLKEIYDLINNQARLDESKRAYVKMCFSESKVDTDRYEITRTWTWSNGIISEDFTATQNGDLLDEETSLNFQNYLLHLIPPELHKLYFFDGEKIAEYFLGEQHNNIKEALLVLSGNDTYEILYNSVRRLLNGVESDSKSFAQEYADKKDVLAKYARQEAALLRERQDIAIEIERLESGLRREDEAYASTGGVTLEQWKALQHSLKDEEERRERLNGNLKGIAADVLPFLIVKDLLMDVREQIDLEKALHAYRVLQDSLGAPRFKRHLTSAVKKTSSQDPASDAAILINAIQAFFENRDLEAKEPVFMLSEDESASVLNKISFIEDYKTSAISQGRREIEASIQHSTALREQLQRSSIENFEAHVERVAQGIHLSAVSVIHLVLIAERHMSDFFPTVLKLAQTCDSLLAGSFSGDFFEFGNHLALGAEIFSFLLAGTRCGFFLCVKERIARFLETAPHSIAVFLGDSAYGLPFFLHRYEFVGGRFPVGRVLEGFGTFGKGCLAGKVLG